MTLCEVLVNLGISVLSIILALLYAKLGAPRLVISLKPPKETNVGNEKTRFV